MDNVFCSGTENALTDCSYSATHNCVHREDASVVCIQRPGKYSLVTSDNITLICYHSELQ